MVPTGFAVLTKKDIQSHIQTVGKNVSHIGIILYIYFLRIMKFLLVKYWWAWSIWSLPSYLTQSCFSISGSLAVILYVTYISACPHPHSRVEACFTANYCMLLTLLPVTSLFSFWQRKETMPSYANGYCLPLWTTNRFKLEACFCIFHIYLYMFQVCPPKYL